MNVYMIFDIVVLILMIFFGIKSIPNGFIKEFFGFLGIVVGIILASSYNSSVAVKLIELTNINNVAIMSFVAFVVVVVAFWLSMFLLSLIMSKIINLSGMAIFDKIFGPLIGAFKIFLLLSIISYMLLKIDFVKNKSYMLTKKTISFPMLVTVGTFLMNTDSKNISTDGTTAIDSVVQIVKEKSKDTTNILQNGVNNLQNAVEKKLDDTVNDEDSYIQNNQNIDDNDYINNIDIDELK